MHGTSAGDVEHAAVHISCIIFAANTRYNNPVKFQAFGQMGTGNKDTGIQG